MRTLQTISDLSSKSGGPSTCTLDLLMGLQDIHAEVDLLTVSTEDILGKGSLWLKDVPNDYKTPMGLSKNVKRALENSDYNLYHANALWSYTSHITCEIARKKNRPYILTPHGMLYPTALAISRWKKIPMLKLWFNKDIHLAACLHATCVAEMENCRTFGYRGPIAVIPNAVVFPDGVELKNRLVHTEGTRKQIGFLGRLHPIKKVENIIYAINKLSKDFQEQVSLQIMGKYDVIYEQWLKSEVKRLRLEQCVEFVDFVTGQEKYDRLSKLYALMVPSTQENFGMIVPEALICGTPVYASLGTPWSELNEYNAGWWEDNSPETIAKLIMKILSMSETELLEMGKNGRKLMLEKYEQHKVAGMMKRLYEWIVEDKQDLAKKPEFVFL